VILHADAEFRRIRAAMRDFYCLERPVDRASPTPASRLLGPPRSSSAFGLTHAHGSCGFAAAIAGRLLRAALSRPPDRAALSDQDV